MLYWEVIKTMDIENAYVLKTPHQCLTVTYEILHKSGNYFLPSRMIQLLKYFLKYFLSLEKV